MLYNIKMQSSKQVGKFVVCGSLLIIFCLSLFTYSVFAESSAGIVKKANKLYKNKKYDEALKEYDRALSKSPDSAIVNFDIGAAQYKKGDYEKAVSSITKALIVENEKLEAKANYNIGNCKYKQAVLKENTDLSSAIGLLRGSLDYYKRAIELDEEGEDAKFNHEFVEKKLKELLEKQKKQKEQQQEQKQDKKKEKDEKKSESQKKEEQGDKDKDKKEDQGKEEGKKNKGKEEKDKREREEGKGEQKQKAEKSEEMSEQEAKMLLEGYKHEEESAEKLRKMKQKGYYSDVLKDW